jgi:DNA-binding MarR family transcriptional regulator
MVLAPENLPFQLHLLVQGMTRRMQGLLQPFNLTPLHWGMLCCLWRRDGLSTTEFTEQLSQLGGTITVALQAMERRKLIRRRPHPRDGRASQIFLTARGRALEQELVPAAANLIQDLFRDLSPAEYKQFADTVSLLRTRT